MHNVAPYIDKLAHMFFGDGRASSISSIIGRHGLEVGREIAENEEMMGLGRALCVSAPSGLSAVPEYETYVPENRLEREECEGVLNQGGNVPGMN